MKKLYMSCFILCFVVDTVLANPNEDLFSAVRAMDEVALRDALGRGANVNHISGGKTALMEAAAENWIYGAEILLEGGANHSAASDSGWTALDYAVRNDAGLEIVKLLVNGGAGCHYSGIGACGGGQKCPFV